LFVLFCHIEISETTTPHCTLISYYWNVLDDQGCIGGGFVMFRHMVQQNYWKLNKKISKKIQQNKIVKHLMKLRQALGTIGKHLMSWEVERLHSFHFSPLFVPSLHWDNNPIQEKEKKGRPMTRLLIGCMEIIFLQFIPTIFGLEHPKYSKERSVLYFYI